MGLRSSLRHFDSGGKVENELVCKSLTLSWTMSEPFFADFMPENVALILFVLLSNGSAPLTSIDPTIWAMLLEELLGNHKIIAHSNGPSLYMS